MHSPAQHGTAQQSTFLHIVTKGTVTQIHNFNKKWGLDKAFEGVLSFDPAISFLGIYLTAIIKLQEICCQENNMPRFVKAK